VEHEHGNGHAPLHGAYSEYGLGNSNGQDVSERRESLSGQNDAVSPVISTGQSIYSRKLEYAARSLAGGTIEPAHGPAGSSPDERTAVKPASDRQRPQLQRVGEARRRQGLSIRCVAQRLGLSVSEVRAQEEEHADMSLSELYRWQSVLDVPLEELLADPQDALSPRILMRARMLRVMKTAQALRASARSESEHRLAKLLISQLIEIMPELKEVAAWPTVGHRRTADEMGRIAERPVSDDFMHEAI
jgi:transcriptional regulator with XRE-family HTH domain